MGDVRQRPRTARTNPRRRCSAAAAKRRRHHVEEEADLRLGRSAGTSGTSPLDHSHRWADVGNCRRAAAAPSRNWLVLRGPGLEDRHRQAGQRLLARHQVGAAAGAQRDAVDQPGDPETPVALTTARAATRWVAPVSSSAQLGGRARITDSTRGGVRADVRPKGPPPPVQATVPRPGARRPRADSRPATKLSPAGSPRRGTGARTSRSASVTEEVARQGSVSASDALPASQQVADPGPPRVTAVCGRLTALAARGTSIGISGGPGAGR